MRSFSIEISAQLAKVSSVQYALIYLCCIPLFAIWYDHMPGEFYHATAKHEAYLNHNADQIMADLALSLRTQNEQEIGASVRRVGGDVTYVEYDLSSLRFTKPEVAEERIYFYASIRAAAKDTGKNSAIEFEDHAHLSITG